MSQPNSPEAWSRAFARQALCDLEAYSILTLGSAPKCQRLHFLQMACEKVCKAYLSAGGKQLDRTHAVIEKYLPLLIRNIVGVGAASGTRMKQIRSVCRELELLAPACDASGSRPDNAEYPWQDVHGTVEAPCDYPFPRVDDQDRLLVPILRYVRQAAERYAR